MGYQGRKTMSRQKLSLSFAFSVVVASGSIAGQIPIASAEPLKIASGSSWIGWGPLHIAEEKGYFKAEGLEVEVTYFDWDTPQEGFDLLANKQIDGPRYDRRKYLVLETGVSVRYSNGFGRLLGWRWCSG